MRSYLTLYLKQDFKKILFFVFLNNIESIVRCSDRSYRNMQKYYEELSEKQLNLVSAKSW